MGWDPFEKEISLGSEAGFTPSNSGAVTLPLHWDVIHCGVEQAEEGGQRVFRCWGYVLEGNVVIVHVTGEQDCWVCGFRTVDCRLLDHAVYWTKIEEILKQKFVLRTH